MRLQPKDGRGPIAAPRLVPIASSFEDFTPSDHLRVLRVLDLQPGRRHAVRLVPTLAPFADDALEVATTCGVEECSTATAQVVDVQEPRIDARHDRAEASLAFTQRPIAQIRE